MKRLYGTTDPAEAEDICILLRAKGIEPNLDRGDGTGPIDIQVRDEDAAGAAEALARHFELQDPGASADPPPEDPPRGLWPSFLRFLGLGMKKKEPAP